MQHIDRFWTSGETDERQRKGERECKVKRTGMPNVYCCPEWNGDGVHSIENSAQF